MPAAMNGEKKGELSELKNSLRQLAGSRQAGIDELKRELFKKVISYMTIGVDVTSLFTEMIMCSATNDLVLKKMCYLYICNYASSNAELALLTINFLQRDCQDDDPMIRGLALRSLCALRVKGLVEYLVGPLRTALKDSNSYVRATASMGVLKLHHLAPAVCKDSEFLHTLKQLLQNDSDPQVVANCFYGLREMSSEETASASDRGYLLSKTVLYSLLNRIKGFSEWAQCMILELCSQYEPTDPNEAFDIMNLLEDRLQHANSAVVLATTKVFLHLTMSMPDVHQQVYERIKAPLLTLMSMGTPELSYAVLSHLHLLVTRAPMLFALDYKTFYCRFSDPSYVKKLKLEMLTAVANESNMYDIVTELSEYAANVDVVIARESIRAVGQIALQCYDVNGIVDRLLQFLDMDTDYVTAETLVLVKDLLRKYPEWAESCIAVVGGVASSSVNEPRAKAALIWMLGEYGETMAEAPYTLEGLVENWKEEESEAVRLELLTAVAKLFFKRPPECQKVLGAALKAASEDANQDVHDRGLLYYRLLQAGVQVAERVIGTPKQAVNEFAEAQSSEIKDRIFDEFNTLAVVYRKPSYQFLGKDQVRLSPSDTERPPPTSPPPARPLSPPSVLIDSDSGLLSATEKEESRAPPVPVNNGPEAYAAPDVMDIMSAPIGIPSPPPPMPSLGPTSAPTPGPTPGLGVTGMPGLGATPRATGMPSLGASPVPSQGATPSLGGGLDDLLGLGPLENAPLTFGEPMPPALQLNPKPVVDAATFQKKWAQLGQGELLEERLPPSAVAKLTSPQPLLRHMAANSIQCMASGGAAPSFKFFFFAQNLGSAPGTGLLLVEVVCNTAKASASVRVKAEDASIGRAFADMFRGALSTFSTS